MPALFLKNKESSFDSIDIDFLKRHSNIFVACSGGMDSMSLVHLLISQKIKFSVIHCNFKLRGVDSDEDERFVSQYCETLKIPFYSFSFNTLELAKKNGNSIEMEARNLRYSCFETMTKEHSIDLLLTAHHREDQIETIFMRIMKGTGVKGLKGIPRYRKPNYYRPFLHIPKSDIKSYVQSNQIAYREDKSNKENDYERNKIRNIYIPKIEETYPEMGVHLVQLATIAGQMDAWIEDQIVDLKRLWNETNRIDLSAYRDKPYLPLVVYSILESYSPNTSQIEMIQRHIMDSESKRIEMGTQVLELKNGILERYQAVNKDWYVAQTIEELMSFPFFECQILTQKPLEYQKETTYINLEALKMPIQVIPIQDGLTIQPIGMNGKSKKISDLIQSLKWTVNQKNKAKLLQDADHNIIALVGVCTSEIVKINPKSNSILSIKNRS